MSFKNLIVLTAVFVSACDFVQNEVYTNTPYIYGFVGPTDFLYFNLAYVRKNAENVYNSGRYKYIDNANVQLFVNGDSIQLNKFVNDDNIDYRITLSSKLNPGDHIGIKAEMDGKLLYWSGYLSTDYPICINLPQNDDTVDINIVKKNIDYPDWPGLKKDLGHIFVELMPTGTRKLKRFSYSIDEIHYQPHYGLFTFKDTISIPLYLDTNLQYIHLRVGFQHIDSNIAAAYLLDGFAEEKEMTYYDDEFKQYLHKAQKLSLRERSNVQGDGVGLIFYESHDMRRLTGRIRR